MAAMRRRHSIGRKLLDGANDQPRLPKGCRSAPDYGGGLAEIDAYSRCDVHCGVRRGVLAQGVDLTDDAGSGSAGAAEETHGRGEDAQAGRVTSSGQLNSVRKIGM